MDYYAILGVHPTAEDIVIRAAYKALAQRYHPDRFSGSKDEAHRKMSDLTKAYEVLADPVRRRKYDRRRLTYTQSVATYFNGSPRFAPPALDPRDLRVAAAKRRRSRVALSALMVAVVVLSAFNLFQYSAQIRGWLSASAPAPSTASDPNSRRTADASVTGTAGEAPGDAPPAAVAARTPNLPIGQGSAMPAPAEGRQPPAPAPQRAEPAAAETALPTGSGEVPPRQAGADARPAAATPDAVPRADAPLRREDERTASKAARGTTAPADRPSTPSAAAAASGTCTDVVVALGLCSPNTTARKK